MMSRAFLGSFARDHRGAQAVEFAIIAPILFAFVFGIFEIGRLMFEESRISAAAAVGARAVALYGAADEAAIQNAIEAKLPYAATIAFEDVTFGAQDFKKIDVTYNFNFLIKFTPSWSGVTVTATRYAAAAS